ncbi:von Willebrand factor, type A [Trema orientale]|uniref:von Willebrand factor, type A n=1 Tax=Trema orientale TaxID=63057 RepID=A0A2P5EXS8_TREOI|nr:von Willebrand factor, type A [Trema orientale]
MHGKNLHFLGEELNPYEQAISIISKTLSPFDEDNLIPCYGFGDSSTHDEDVFSFYPDDKPCYSFEEVLFRYRELVPRINLAGPTSFAPITEAAMGIVDSKGGQYHVLVIIADGQNERSTEFYIVLLVSEYPLSKILAGVGDGPWDLMHKFDNYIPARAFDNCQFVNFTKIMLKDILTSNKQT